MKRLVRKTNSMSDYKFLFWNKNLPPCRLLSCSIEIVFFYLNWISCFIWYSFDLRSDKTKMQKKFTMFSGLRFLEYFFYFKIEQVFTLRVKLTLIRICSTISLSSQFLSIFSWYVSSCGLKLPRDAVTIPLRCFSERALLGNDGRNKNRVWGQKVSHHWSSQTTNAYQEVKVLLLLYTVNHSIKEQ